MKYQAIVSLIKRLKIAVFVMLISSISSAQKFKASTETSDGHLRQVSVLRFRHAIRAILPNSCVDDVLPLLPLDDAAYSIASYGPAPVGRDLDYHAHMGYPLGENTFVSFGRSVTVYLQDNFRIRRVDLRKWFDEHGGNIEAASEEKSEDAARRRFEDTARRLFRYAEFVYEGKATYDEVRKTWTFTRRQTLPSGVGVAMARQVGIVDERTGVVTYIEDMSATSNPPHLPAPHVSEAEATTAALQLIGVEDKRIVSQDVTILCWELVPWLADGVNPCWRILWHVDVQWHYRTAVGAEDTKDTLRVLASREVLIDAITGEVVCGDRSATATALAQRWARSKGISAQP